MVVVTTGSVFLWKYAYEVEPIFAVLYCLATDVEIFTLAYAVDFTDFGAYRASPANTAVTVVSRVMSTVTDRFPLR
jgi:hypothetical protein